LGWASILSFGLGLDGNGQNNVHNGQTKITRSKLLLAKAPRLFHLHALFGKHLQMRFGCNTLQLNEFNRSEWAIEHMKTALIILSCLFIASSGNGQVLNGSSSAYRNQNKSHLSIGERGPNHRVIQRVTVSIDDRGRRIQTTNVAYVELATGMHYWSGNQWIESKEQIDVLPEGGAASTNGAYKAYFPCRFIRGKYRDTDP